MKLFAERIIIFYASLEETIWGFWVFWKQNITQCSSWYDSVIGVKISYAFLGKHESLVGPEQ